MSHEAPNTEPTAAVWSEAKALQWFEHQHLFAWIRQPDQAEGRLLAGREERRRALALEQPILPRSILAEYSTASLTHTLAALVAEAAASTSIDASEQRLSRIQILHTLAQAATSLALTEGRRAIRDGATLAQVAEVLGVTPQRVHQIVFNPRARSSPRTKPF